MDTHSPTAACPMLLPARCPRPPTHTHPCTSSAAPTCRAFARLGFECTSWPLHLYADLMRSGDGTAEAMVERYFDTVGWPMFLPTAGEWGVLQGVQGWGTLPYWAAWLQCSRHLCRPAVAYTA
jgi:hypothetical protein